MKYDLTFNVLWETKKFVSVLNRELDICFISEDFDKLPPTDHQIALLDSLDNLPSSIITQLNDWARKYFQSCMINWRIPDEEIIEEFGFEIDKERIQNHYKIDKVIIPRINSCSDNYVFLAGECDWDIEHGIEFLLKNRTPIQCTAQDGLCFNEAWDEYLK